MPEPVAQPPQPNQPQPAERKGKATPGEPLVAIDQQRELDPPKLSKTDEIRKKYRLDQEVNIYARAPDGTRIGHSVILDQAVFNKFAELDKTRNKKYLDWMLFQAGGGVEAFKKSRDNWGDGTPDKTPEEFFTKFEEQRPDHTIYLEEIKSVAEKLKDKGLDFHGLYTHVPDEITRLSQIPDRVERYKALVDLFKRKNVCPGREGRVAVELIGNKFKVWTRQQLGTKTRDRVHATSIYSRMTRGIDRQTAEAKWKEAEPRRRREYIFGDQDSLKWEAFGYHRTWPGRNNIYETVYNQMRQFLINKKRVEDYNERLEAYNARIQERNKTLPPGEQIPLRQGLNFNLDIGKITTDAEGNLKYKGAYPTVHSLASVNDQIAETPMKERVARDVKYAGPKGTASKSTKLYSDPNIDVLVPLTVAAAIQAGLENWEVSDPEQLSNVKAQGHYDLTAWTKYHTGQHGHAEWAQNQAIPIFFHLKAPGIKPEIQRLWLTVFLGDLVDLQWPYVATVWLAPSLDSKVGFKEMMNHIKANTPSESYPALAHSIMRAMRAIRDWGKEFNPEDVVADYVKTHRERLQGKRTFDEQIKLRAYQVIQTLLE
jgi:hypothetical protein